MTGKNTRLAAGAAALAIGLLGALLLWTRLVPEEPSSSELGGVSQAAGDDEAPVAAPSVEVDTARRAGQTSGAARLRIVVRDAGDGTPVRSYTLELLGGGDARPTLREVVDAPDGTTSVPLGGHGSYSLWIVAHGYRPAPRVAFDWRTAGPPRPIDVCLERGSGIVRGRVVDDRSGAGIEGAVVLPIDAEPGRSLPWARRQAVAGTVSDANGGFELDHCFDAGQLGIVLRATHLRYRPAECVAKPHEHVEIRLEPGARIFGCVRDDAGTPLDAARILLNGDVRDSFLSGSDGAYSTYALPPGDYSLWCRSPSNRLPWMPMKRVQLGVEDIRVDFGASDRSHSLTGRVRFLTGELPPDCTLRLSRAGGGRSELSYSIGMVAADGTFAVSLDEPGIYSVHLQRQGDVSLEWRAPQAVKVPATGPLLLDVDGASVRGLVVTVSHGQPRPVAACDVSFWKGSSTLVTAKTDEEGRFGFEALAAGEHRVAVAEPFRLVEPRRLELASTSRVRDLVIQVQRETGIVLTLRDVSSQDGGLRVRAMQGDRACGDVAGSGSHWVIHGLAAGTYEVQVDCVGGAPLRSVPIEVRQGEMATHAMTLASAATGSVRGILLDSDPGWPRMRTIVQAVREGEPWRGSNARWARREGADYVIRGLAPGRWDLYLWPAGSGRQAVGTVDVKAGETTRRDLRLGGGELLLKLVDGDCGGPVRVGWATVALKPQAAGASVTSQAQDADEIRLRRLAPGRYSVEVDARGWLLGRVEAVLVPVGSSTTITVPLSRGGTIVVRRDHLPRGYDLWLETTDGKRVREARRPDGANLAFPGTPPGRYVVVVRENQSKRVSRTPAEVLGTETCFVTPDRPR